MRLSAPFHGAFPSAVARCSRAVNRCAVMRRVSAVCDRQRATPRAFYSGSVARDATCTMILASQSQGTGALRPRSGLGGTPEHELGSDDAVEVVAVDQAALERGFAQRLAFLVRLLGDLGGVLVTDL